MTIFPFEEALRGLLSLAMGIILFDFARASLKRGYVYGLWWDFQRDTQPKRFWLYIAFLIAVAFGQVWYAVPQLAKIIGLS